MSQVDIRLFRDLTNFAYQQKHPYFRAALDSNQTISGQEWVKLKFEVVDLDTHNWFNVSTYEYTPLLSGIYLFYARVAALSLADQTYAYATIYKNGVAAGQAFYRISNTGYTDDIYPFVCAILEMNGIDDYVSAYTYFRDAGGGSVNAPATDTSFSGFRIPK
jgi:hypothetical protein